jgi:murein L,D-transpeptidase YafK
MRKKLYILLAIVTLSASILLWPHSVSLQGKADHVLVEKAARRLQLMQRGQVIATFSIALGAAPVGHKVQEGDERTPEGSYRLDYKHAGSNYYKAIHISYPAASDTARARKLGVDPGGAIMIHGQRDGWGWLWRITQRFDWTNGCVALNDAEMEALWRAVDVGTPITIKP